ncbi:MAG: glycosyl transferase 4, partial [Lachnospiraceae bacterium]|nr:glycosyl transferase 4 [Lachnospiraceae bacterium]
MRILWVCNSMPRRVAAVLGKIKTNKEGWIDGALGRLEESGMLKDDGTEEGFSLALTCPASDKPDLSGTYLCKKAELGNGNSLSVYEFYEDTVHPENYDKKEELSFEGIIKDFDPDIVHVFGTEYGHTLAAGRVIKKLRDNGGVFKLIIGIQGVISECALRYADGVPEDVIRSETFRDIIKNDNIDKQRCKFAKRGEYELEAITYATDIIGRTDFDREWSHKHNPSAVYHLLNETLRSEFYEGTWDVTSCDRHVIFMSQGDYPLKGFHFV